MLPIEYHPVMVKQWKRRRNIRTEALVNVDTRVPICQYTNLCSVSFIILSHRQSLFSFDPRKDVIDIIMGIQRRLVQCAFMNALDDFLAGENEDRIEKLNALLLVCRR
jgi:hypothetical protein